MLVQDLSAGTLPSLQASYVILYPNDACLDGLRLMMTMYDFRPLQYLPEVTVNSSVYGSFSAT